MAGGGLQSLWRIKLYGPEAFAGVRKAGRLVLERFDMLAPEIMSGSRPSISTRSVFEFAIDYGAMPATLMCRGYAWVAGARSARYRKTEPIVARKREAATHC
jgi:methionyl aminopeptidase